MAPGGLKISVVIPAWNEQASIGALLDSLVQQTRPPDEVLVVDAGSTDGTASIVRNYRGAPVTIRLLAIGRAHPGVARNAGVQAAGCDRIAFTDCGIRLDPHWLQALCTALEQQPGTQVVYGSYEPVTDTFFSQCAATVYVPPRSRRDGKLLRGPSVASCLLDRTVWQSVGGFPPYRAAEDLVFLECVKQQGFPVAYAPDAVAYWELTPNLAALFRKYSQYSYHNLVARRGYAWHAGVARLYGAGLCWFGLGVLSGWPWLAAPGVLFGARVALAFYRRRGESWTARWRDPRRWLLVGLVMLAFDAATIAGSLTWLWRTAQGRLSENRCDLEASGL